MMHVPTGSEHPGREGGREGGRLQDMCDCPTYNAFSDRCHGSQRSGNVENLVNTSLGSKGEETSTAIKGVSSPLYFRNRNINLTTTMMSLVSTMMSLVSTMMSLVSTMMSLVSGESSGQRQ